MAKSMPSIHDLNHLFLDESACIHFLMENRIFYKERNCDVCGAAMVLKIERSIL
jgi:hypothetical protein